MRTYLISYDLAKPNRNQHVLAQLIMGLGEKWARPLSNTWYVASERDEVELEAELKDLLADDDGLLISGDEARSHPDQHVAALVPSTPARHGSRAGWQHHRLPDAARTRAGRA